MADSDLPAKVRRQIVMQRKPPLGESLRSRRDPGKALRYSSYRLLEQETASEAMKLKEQRGVVVG